MPNIKKATWYRNTGKANSQKLNTNNIKDSLNPFDFYSHELPNTPLKRHSWNDGGLCPVPCRY